MDKNNNQIKAQKDQSLFNSIAESYSKKDFSESSRTARKLRLKQTLAKVNLSNDIDIIEIGCGAGFAATYLEGSYKNYTGIDYSEKLIKNAKYFNKKTNISFIAKDLYQFGTKKKYDILFMIGVLHHMVDMDHAIKVACSFIKPGGYIVVNEPQKANPLIHLLRIIRSKTDKSYSEDQEELNIDHLISLFKNAGLTNVKSFPQGLFSTPFAEVVLNPQFIFKYLSKIVCSIDKLIEDKFTILLNKLSWNTIIIGQKEL
ncbi:MAG: methyltransferase domain-containing protein [Planctomycetia bacterium]|nr:methyltransferase domain-containing protein [Planctomycetia bacterium]